MFDGVFEGLAWLLAFFYDLTHSYGVSIMLLTLAVMVVVTPLTLKGTKSMMAMQRLQPDMRRIQQECAGDRQRLNEEMLKFYRENDINPMGSCLPMLIQMPIFLVLFKVVQGLTHMVDGAFDPKYLSEASALYQSLKGQTEMLFIGFDLEKSPKDALLDRGFLVALPYMFLIALWVGTSYLQQMQVAGRNSDAMTPQQKMMMRVIPIFSLSAVFFPAALSIYWVTSNLCRVATQGYISHRFYNVGGLGLGKKKEGGTPVIDVKAKPAKPAAGKDSPGTKKPANTKNDGGKGGTKPARPASGRVTPAKGATPSSPARRPQAPGRRTNAPTTPSGERGRRRVPNGPSGSESTGDTNEDPRKKRRK